MAKKKSNASAVSSQLKNSLKQLQKMGLYNPKHPRKAPTKYAKSLIKKHSDVLSGRVQVVKVPRSYTKELAGQFRTKRTKKGAVAFVPKAGGMTAEYSKKEKSIIRKLGVFRLRPVKDRQVLLRGQWPEMKKGEHVVVRIGNNFVDFYSLEEVRRKMADYNPAETTLWQYPYIASVSKR